MNSINRQLVAVFALFLIAATAQAFVGNMVVGMGQANQVGDIEVAFSADAQVETEEQKFNTRVYYKDKKLRDEMNMGKQQIVTITRHDLDKVWVLMGQGMYVENAVGQSQQQPDYKLLEKSVEGNETVNGRETTKYKTVYQGPDGKFGGFTWFDKYQIAVKGFIVSEQNGEKNRLLWNLSNVQVKDQPDGIFELPAGAKQFKMPDFGGMMGGGMMNGQGMQNSAPPTSYPQTPAPNASQQASMSAQGAATGSDQESSQNDPNIASEAGQAARDGAREGAVEESKKTAKDLVKKGFGAIFGN